MENSLVHSSRALLIDGLFISYAPLRECTNLYVIWIVLPKLRETRIFSGAGKENRKKIKTAALINLMFNDTKYRKGTKRLPSPTDTDILIYWISIDSSPLSVHNTTALQGTLAGSCPFDIDPREWGMFTTACLFCWSSFRVLLVWTCCSTGTTLTLVIPSPVKMNWNQRRATMTFLLIGLFLWNMKPPPWPAWTRTPAAACFSNHMMMKTTNLAALFTCFLLLMRNSPEMILVRWSDLKIIPTSTRSTRTRIPTPTKIT